MNLAMSDAFPESSRIPIAESKAWQARRPCTQSAYRDLLRVAFVLTGSAAGGRRRRARRVRQGRPANRHAWPSLPRTCGSLWSIAAGRCIADPSPRRAPDRPTDAVMDVGLVELRDALIALPIRQRSAIVLRYLCDLPEEEIAANLKCRRSTVRTLVRRGLAELREVIR